MTHSTTMPVLSVVEGHRAYSKQQHGSTLLVALIMLVLLTLVAVSAINSTTSSIQMVGNAQFREEANAVAQKAIEQVISTNFTIAPASSTVSVDINSDGQADYIGQVDVPLCTSSVELTDGSCASSAVIRGGAIVGASGVLKTTQLGCYKQTWELKSTVADSRTGANATVHQGVFLRVPTGTLCP